MKINSVLLGLIIGLTVGILTQVVRTTSHEVSSIILGCVLMVPVGIIGIRYRKAASRDQRMFQAGLEHYRNHHHRKVIKKTS